MKKLTKITKLIAGVLAGVMLFGTTAFAKEEVKYNNEYYHGFAEDEVIIADTNVVWYTVPNKTTPANIGIRVAGVTNKGNLVTEGWFGEPDGYLSHSLEVWTPDKLSPTFNPAYGTQIDQATVYQNLLALKTTYPEGMSWTEANTYSWSVGKSGTVTGIGCMAFARQVSDLLFGVNAPLYGHSDINNIKVGDIIVTNAENHAVVALEVHDDYIVVAEGNYNSTIHWGRKVSKSELLRLSTDITTRY